MVPDTTNMMLRASALINISSEMLFVGMYRTDTYKPIALVDRDKVHINPEADTHLTRTFDFNIECRQVQAIANHIRTKDNPFTQINIAGLHFVCLRNGSGCMTGMSNFNMDYVTSTTTKDVKETLFELTDRHYESQELLSEIHPLQISAILKEDIVVIGLCKSGGSCSSLKLLREILEQPPEQPSEKINLPSDGSGKVSFVTKSSSLRASLKSFSNLVDQGVQSWGGNLNVSQDSELNAGASTQGSLSSLLDSIDINETKASTGDLSVRDDNIERRASTKTAEDRRREQFKRETEFCEDWRTATMKSIEALQMIGTMASAEQDTDDRSPLVENIDMEAGSGESLNEFEERGKRLSSLKKKRPSRSTFV